MIVCLCSNVSDSQIGDLANQGKELGEVIEATKAGTCCGACTSDVKNIFTSKQCRSSLAKRTESSGK